MPYVYEFFEKLLIAIEETMHNINFPTTVEKCRVEANLFDMKRNSLMNGTIPELDGMTVPIQKPNSLEVSGAKKYRNRKIFLAVLVPAAVTADYKFAFLSATHQGGGHYSPVIEACSLHILIIDGTLPHWGIIVPGDA